MSEMIERLILAMQDIAGKEDLNEVRAESLARAAIRAMRKPTQEMLDAGAEAFAHYTDDQESTHLWQAMIDEALK